MGKPKTSTTSRRTKTRRSGRVVNLARKVNRKSPVKAYTTRRESGKKLIATIKAITAKKIVKAEKPAKAKAA